MDTPIEAVEIQGFKSIAQARVELQAINVLIGANGSGKSNFVSVFEFMRGVCLRGLQGLVAVRGGPERFLRFNRKVTPEFKLAVQFRDVSWETLFTATDGNQLLLTENTRGSGGYRGTGATPQFMQPESELEEAARREPQSDAAIAWKALSGIGVFHFGDISRDAAVKQPAQVNDNRSLQHDAANLAAVLLRMRNDESSAYGRVLKIIRLIAPFFREFDLRPTNGVVTLGWFENGSDRLFDIHSLSDGTLRLICLATMLFQPERPQLIVVDEPELGLHPAAIQVLAGLFRSVTSEFGVQIVAATQSTTLVNQLAPEDILVVERSETDGTTFRRLAETDIAGWLDGYALGDLWEKNLLGGRPR